MKRHKEIQRRDTSLTPVAVAMWFEWINIMISALTLVVMISLLTLCLQCRKKSKTPQPPEENIHGIENLTYYESDVKVMYNPQSGALELSSASKHSGSGDQAMYISGTIPESPVCQQIHKLLASGGLKGDVVDLHASELTERGQKRFEQTAGQRVQGDDTVTMVTMETDQVNATNMAVDNDKKRIVPGIVEQSISHSFEKEHTGYDQGSANIKNDPDVESTNS